MQIFGLLVPMHVIGTLNLNKMAVSFTKVVSYNLRGFNQGQYFLSDICESNDLIALQKLWLCDHHLDKITNFSSDFSVVAVSAMTEKVQQGFLHGRPFGGLAILARKSVIKGMYKIGIDSQSRALAVIVKFGFRLLVVNVYLPCFAHGDDYVDSVLEILGFIENCIEGCTYDRIIILGDFNFNCECSSPGYRLLYHILNEYKLISCEEYADPSVEFTYFQDSLDRSSLIDHMFVSAHFVNNIIQYSIIESGINLSDHVPIRCVLALPGTSSCPVQRPKLRRHCTLRWDKEDVNLYYHITGESLQRLEIPYELLNGCSVLTIIRISLMAIIIPLCMH